MSKDETPTTAFERRYLSFNRTSKSFALFFVLVFVCLYDCDEHPIPVASHIVRMMMMMDDVFCDFGTLLLSPSTPPHSAFFVIIGRDHYIIATSSLYYSYREKHQWKFVLKKLVW